MASSSAEVNINLGNESEILEQPVELPLMSGLDCIVCGKGQPAYKCPTCYAKYCSVNCCKTHKLDGKCEAPKSNQQSEENSEISTKETTRNYYYPTKDTVPVKKLEMLSQNDNLVQLKKFFENPTIRSSILKLDTCADPISEFMDVMENEDFVQFSAFITNELNKDEVKTVRRDLE